MKISNSQIMSLQTCERRFYYEHILKLKPIKFPDAVDGGIFGHGLFEHFFKAMQQGVNYDEAVTALNPVIEANLHNTELLKLYRHVLAFGAYAYQQEWKVASAEESVLFEVEEGLEFAYTPDLIVEWTAGLKRGTRAALDFKFTGQYWTPKELGVFQQLPKYMVYQNKINDVKIAHCGVVMLNTRASANAVGTDLFKIGWVPLSKKKLQRIELENETMMRRVKYVKENYKEPDYMRTVNTFTCKLCWFAEKLCPMQLEGRDVSRVLKHSYEHNKYFEENYETEEIDND